MFLVIVKFIEVFTRAVFVVGTAYSLRLEAAGQFGVVATLVGLFAFAFNWERQVDIQRRNAGGSDAEFDRAVAAAVPFWGFNQLLMMPLFIGAVWVLAKLTPFEMVLAAIIVSCEHVANQTYQMALISKRYTVFLGIVAGKNVAVLGAVLPFVVFAPSQLTLDYALGVWAIGQLVCAILVGALWLARRVKSAHDDGLTAWQRITAQHRASFTHFQMGFVAILMLQYDRLVVRALVPLDETGVYFRHILIVSFVYQFFNVASFNRVMPSIFAAARTENDGQLFARLRPEIVRMFAVVAIGFAISVGIDAATGHMITAKYHLSIIFAGVLVSAALIRIVADFTGMILNARHREALVLRQQIVTFAVTAPVLAVLTHFIGIGGAVAASLVASVLYLALIRRAYGATQKETVV